MEVEFRGSVMLFALQTLFADTARPLRVGVALAAALYYAAPNYLFLLVGFSLKHHPLGSSLDGTKSGYALGCVAVAVYFTTMLLNGSGYIFYFWSHYLRSASLLVLAHSVPPARRLLECRVSVFLGKHSFMIYVCHMSILALVNKMRLAFLPFTATVFALSAVFSVLVGQFIDAKSRKFSALLAGWVMDAEWKSTAAVVAPDEESSSELPSTPM